MLRILLVAPDSDLRKSLEFALQAEGYEVTSRASIGARERPGAYECTVIDHHALGNNSAAAADFCSVFAPVILLTNHPGHPLAPLAFRTLLKPLLGAALIGAVRDAMAAARSNAT
jgi:DNA-binding NtrC family response regulator